MSSASPYVPIGGTLSAKHMLVQMRGYTLIEFIVVVALIGIMLGVSAPKIRDALFTDPLKGTARKMVGLIHEARNESIRIHEAHTLHMDMGSSRFWMDRAAMNDEEMNMARKNGHALSDGVKIQDVWLAGKGKKSAGETQIRLNEKGYIQPSAIHLSCEDGRQWTLVLSPFLGKVKILEKYVDFVP